MAQAADVRPEPNIQRKAAIANGGARDHAGRVRVEPIPDFDLDRTIFQTLKGSAARYIVKQRIGKEHHWPDAVQAEVQTAYQTAIEGLELPQVDPALMAFLVQECDFDVEHADGSFLDHLYFCYEYTAKYYPEQSPLPMLLHSILGTGTNTFAMDASKIPTLRGMLSDFDWRQTEAFPSVLRLLYAGPLRAELRANVHRPGALRAIRMHRVIDNEPIELTGEDFWIAMNYQLIHLVDFMPVANWSTHRNDTSFILFRDLYDLMEQAGTRHAHVAYTPGQGSTRHEGEPLGLGGRLASLIPVGLSERMAARSVTQFSEAIGHSLAYEIDWD